MRGETFLPGKAAGFQPFQSTPLMRGETLYPAESPQNRNHFNPLPSCEGRRGHHRRDAGKRHFNPLPSCEGRRDLMAKIVVDGLFQSTPLMRGETRRCISRREKRRHFNPLPSCEGRLSHTLIGCLRAFNFNPLPSCEGRQHKPPKILLDSRQFIQQNHHSSFF